MNIQQKVGDREPLREDAQGTPSASEYPIRALVRADASAMGPLTGQVTLFRRTGRIGYESIPDALSDDGTGPFTWYANPKELIIDPTPEQVAEERAKAGLPPEAAPRPADGTEAEPSSDPRDLALSEIIRIVTEWRKHDDQQAGEEMTAILHLAEEAKEGRFHAR